MTDKERKKLREIEDKIHRGDHCSDNEFLFYVQIVEPVIPVLSSLGPAYSLCQKEMRYNVERVRDWLVNRGKPAPRLD